MSAHFANNDMSFATPAEFSTQSPAVFAPQGEGMLARSLQASVAWFGAALKRRAVINELAMLSDHELTDIGLSRAEIPHVFDRGFALTHSAPRA